MFQIKTILRTDFAHTRVRCSGLDGTRLAGKTTD